MHEPIRRADFVRFVEAKLSYFSCQGCGSASYDVISEENVDGKGAPGRLAVIAFAFPGYDIADGKSADVCGLACTNCGTIRFMFRKVVTNWIAANPTR
ncbi:hypothetical protein [Bradyrhizobium sp. S3.9.1]|uniref:hypothetical protein n=1 Tax=Bradyrhizobium sp. S3.9.1 TaxID=3156431 RepID=UPI0033982743